MTAYRSQPATPAAWADAIAQRIGHYGLGQWFKPLGQWLDLPADLRWLPQSCADGPQQVPAMLRGLQLSVRPLPTFDAAPKPFRLHHVLLETAWFNARLVRERPDACALPLGLDTTDTPERAAKRLAVRARDVASSSSPEPDTLEFLLPGDALVRITFEPSGAGIRWVKLSKLGEALPLG